MEGMELFQDENEENAEEVVDVGSFGDFKLECDMQEISLHAITGSLSSEP